MEPTGIMDNKSLRGLDNKTIGFSVHDLADEEVHFSRCEPDDFYHSQHHHHHHQKHQNPFPPSDMYHQQQHQSCLPTTKLETNSFSDINLYQNNILTAGHYYPTNSHHQTATSDSTNDVNDQVRSSRLLNSIGSKIRRGSSYYLIAPKLVGQYLLGITIQNWSEFLNTSRMLKAPTTRHQLTRRLLANLNYFQGNYLCVSLILIIYCILTSPLLLLAIASYLLALYLVTARSALGKQMKIIGYRLNLQQQYSFITMISLPLLWVAGAPSAVFWVIGASFFVVGLHASMYANDRLTPPDSIGNPEIHHNNNPHQLGHLDSNNNNYNNNSRSSSVRYYNHYPNNSTAYAALPGPGTSTTTTTLAPSQIKATGPTSSAGYMSLAHWISFGSGSVNNAGSQDKRGGYDQVKVGSMGPTNKVPEVKIISQDYAGLGRVYEV